LTLLFLGEFEGVLEELGDHMEVGRLKLKLLNSLLIEYIY
jgi:hypothetical protein